MNGRPYRRALLQIGLLAFAVAILLLGYPQGLLSQEPIRSIPVVFPVHVTMKRMTPTSLPRKSAHTPTRTSSTAVTSPLAGSAVWILSCLDGWEGQKIYQSNPYYYNAQGVKKARDIYVFGHFWLQPDTGNLLSYNDQPDMQNCLSNLINTVHTQYHGRVCAVLSVNEATGQWKSADVIAYTKRAVANPALLAPIAQQAKKYPYDCLINDLEDGDNTSPITFTRYEALLRSVISMPLGQTLLWKTAAVSAYWQRWEDWGALASIADFFIVMALDHDSINTPAIPASIVSNTWLKDVYTYMRSIPNLYGTHPVAWELPTYYRLYTRQPGGGWVVSSGTDIVNQLAATSNSKAVLKNNEQDLNEPYLEYMNVQGQTTFLFFETAASSDTLAQTLTSFNGSACLQLSFWDNDSGTSNSLGWSIITSDRNVRLC